MVKRVLVPLDGSKLSEQALIAACGLAKATGCELVLLTAIARQERWADSETPGWEALEEATASGYLDTLARELRDSGFKTKTRVAWGRPSEMILQIADESGADMIVMTTHGRSGVTRWLIGSVADHVLHTTDRPLLLLRGEHEPPGDFTIRTILVPLDGSAFAEASLPFVKDLAKEMDSEVVLEKVIVPPALLYGEQYLPSANQVMDNLEEARDYLEKQMKRLTKAGISVKTAVDDGFPVEAIVSAVENYGADLIALTSHGRTGPARTILGSVADGLVRQAPCPCLIIPVRAKAQEEPASDAPTMLGIEPAPTVIPAPATMEFAAPKRARVKAPEVLPHRPEGITKRKA